MDRRRFLSLKADRRLDLSCVQLFMQSVDAGGESPASDPAGGWDTWQPGEPPTVYERRGARELFDALECDLRTVDVLRVIDAQWLIGDLRPEFDRVVNAFRARGGRVEIDGQPS